MKSGQKNIDQLFKDTLGNFEADVNPSVWKNIEQGLQGPSGNESISNRTFSRMKLKNVISYIVLSGAAILAILYFTAKKSENPAPANSITTSQQTTQTNGAEQKIISPSEATSQVKHENVRVEGSQNRAAEDQKAVKTQVTISEVNSSKENTNTSAPSTIPFVSKNSKETSVQEKNSSVKNNSELTEPLPLKTAEGNKDLNPVNSSEELNSEQPNGNPVFDTDNGFAFYPPDAFSPNGDGLNDYYTPLGHNFKDYEITIFDQLGTEIFNSKEIVNSWDGKLRNGKEAPSGIYFYVIKVKDLSDKSHLYNSRLTLKR